jgi:hypothetical protein
MRQPVRAIAAIGILSVLTVGVSGSPGSNEPGQATVIERPGLIPTHAIRGVVTSVSASVLVITPSGKGAGAMRFVVSPSTHREGNMAIGATVSVRYRVEDQRLLATAVSTQPEEQPGATRLGIGPRRH